jgi:putative ABC transport system ATP-binding protein
MLELKNIEKMYETGSVSFKALRGVDLKIDKGDFVSIIGPSGSGKSTLMNIIGCLDKSTSGTYFLDGKDVQSLNDDELSRFRNVQIGFVFQSFNLLPKLSTLDNVALPMVYAGYSPKERKELAMNSLKVVGLGDKHSNKPTELSGGQKQRVAIARALAMDPGILLADEPTGNLDSKTTAEIMALFQALNDKGHTIVMITHEPEVAELTKRVVTISDGQIVGDKRNDLDERGKTICS